ncbi:reprolysin-like metallopeptidase [Flavobacterium sp. BFFFF1]|uniref:reprolysin-like metallopeptidase n=1 Tax=Flavobacterium sp. BFFFF1 TaxID=2015557 RepID=UPI0025C6AD6A|nr:zinc-dependent metalloprotease family protein [Flavobacterium sp. BFFFF1]
MKQPDRKTIPEKYNVVTLDIPTLRSQLGRAVKRDDNNNLPFAVQIDFPLEDGSTETFNIERVSVLHPDLEAKFTEIRSYFGVSAKNPLNKIFISMDPGGFTGLITGEKTIYIDPYNFRNNGNDYIVYDRSEASRDPENPFICMADMKDLDINLADGMPTPSTARNSIDGKLRTYRIAIACTSEYSAYFGNTMSTILAAVNTTITRVNSVYRNDFAVVFQVVASENRLVYINEFNIDTPTPDPDPYDNYNGSTMLSANTSNITGIIGASAYDIGHVFSTGGGGIASVAPCNASSKGSGVTGIVSPQNDPFDIDYVCHEIGHQFSAGHTYYNACFGSKVSDDYEPGSGTTIMGYAGVCSPNVQYNSDAYFHSRSIAQITAAIATHTCETETAIANTEPIASAGLDYTIPKGTPFTLTGSATDVDTADVLTYCWEQFDATDGGTQPPVGTNTAGPVFRSYFATTSPLRTFPKMSAVVSNTTPTWEVLPSVARALNFRLTVRDNSTLGGQTNSDNMLVTVSTAGPFAVTAPNTAVVWYVGETKTVTWNVAGTSATPVSTANVAIKLSTDGGYTYPVTILASTANDGTENITVPSNIGKNMRIKVEAVGNIYFDISNVDFEIKANTFELTTAQATVPTCKPANAVFSITYTKATPFTETTNFSVTGLPAGATAAFSPTSLAASGTVTMTISGISGVAAGIYPLTFRGISPSANIPLSLTLKVFDNAIGTATLTSPSNGAGNQQTSTLLTWSDLVTASSYLVQISTNPTFSTITETATVTTPYYQTTGLTQGTINYWRIKPINPCIDGAFSEVYVFQIANDLCKTYSNVYFQGNDAVWETTGTNAVSARLDVPDDIMISDVNLTLTGTHTSMTDLKMQFSGPTGNFAEIYNRDCSGSGMNVTWDDSASPIPTGCSGGLTGTKQPNQPLSNFNGSSSLGTWILLATDRVTGAGGTFTGMSMTVCGKLQIVNNVTATINPLGMQSAATATIPSGKLLAVQPSATAAQLTYNITQLPAYGTLKLSGTALTLGGSFTQADVNNNLLTYVHGGANTNPDNFKFSVKGNNTALLGGQVMNINICSVSNTSSQTNVSCFGGTDGSATVAASGGTAPYTYSWSPSGGTAATASALSAGTYTCTITDASGCTKDQSFTITQPTAAISNTTAQTNVSCFGGTDGSATVVASGGTPGYTYLWSPSGGTAASATGLAAGTYTVRITDTKGCFKDQSFTITQPAVLSNTFSQTTISCFGETDATATVIASGGSGVYSYSWSPTGGNSATATNLAPGSYTCTITDSNGCSKIQNFTVSTPIITTWNGSVWDNGYPTNGVKAIVNANYTSVGDLTACQLEVNGSSLVTVQSGHDFNIAGKVTVASNALITFENNANLLQTIDVANSGSIISKRNAQMRRQDYVYWSSPVLNQNLLAFSPLTLTNRFYTLDEPSNAFAPINPSTNSFDVAKGYMIRAPNNFTTAVSTFFGQFIGVPNNGTKTIPVTVSGQGYNLIGNPYPSPVSGNAFLASNPGTLYFWTHTSQDAASGANYASYNTTGGVASIAGGAVPNGTIQTGQGFILSKSSAGVATFTNAMRSGNNNGQFFRDADVERHRIWLNLSDTAGPKNQILVAYMDGATQAFDESIDGELLENGSAISSIIDNSNYVIQGRALPFSDTDSVPLHFKAAAAGTFTIGIDHMDGLFGLGQNVYIKDNLIGLTHNLSSGDYSFDTAEGNFADRFEIVYQSAPLGTETPVMEANHVVVFTQSGIVNVKNSKEEISKIKIFDVRGRLIYEKENINAQTATLNDLKTQQQVLLVQVTSVNNIVVTKKIVY